MPRLRSLASDLPELEGATQALVVVAHPDDESFGLGGVLCSLMESGVETHLLCLTAGEASTVGASSDLGERRRLELAEAATELGLSSTELLDLPDGGLQSIPAQYLQDLVEARLDDADLVVVFEPGGVTGHPDHRAATAAAEAVAARHGLPALEWGLSKVVADQLREQFGAPFVPLERTGFWPRELRVNRRRQRDAILCHRSQDPSNPVLSRRLHLEGDSELVYLRAAPFNHRLERLGRRLAPLLDSPPQPAARVAILRHLVGLAAQGGWGPADASGIVATGPSWTLLVHDASPPSPRRTDFRWGAEAVIAGLAQAGQGQSESGARPVLLARGSGRIIYPEDRPLRSAGSIPPWIARLEVR